MAINKIETKHIYGVCISSEGNEPYNIYLPEYAKSAYDKKDYKQIAFFLQQAETESDVIEERLSDVMTNALDLNASEERDECKMLNTLQGFIDDWSKNKDLFKRLKTSLEETILFDAILKTWNNEPLNEEDNSPSENDPIPMDPVDPVDPDNED